ncbi:ankyrin repeat-containing domain protein [Apodospora peruviana]|uniref:Ankyrin repeat-containing domain protein n=1 Tax=Apodospora peruviana TaxID=516989 RepID=A0AAE0HU46_9PEZI|nr:ankyrin repeat-containing domain protein [Apodospora peruviana]
MRILHLPPELLQHILYYSILARIPGRGVSGRPLARAMRLKLVCKTFYALFTPALFGTETLENAIVTHINYLKYPQLHYHGATETVWLDYLVWRCRSNETTMVDYESIPVRGRYPEIRAVAASLVKYTGREEDYECIIRELCRLALYGGIKYPNRFILWASWQHIRLYTPSNGQQLLPSTLERNLLSAASYFGYLPLVQELVAKEGVVVDQSHWDAHNGTSLFANPAYLAAWAGHADVVRFLLEHLPNYESSTPRRWPDHGIRRHVSRAALVGAASRGDLDMVKVVLFSSSRKAVDSHHHEAAGGEHHGNVPDPESSMTSLSSSLSSSSSSKMVWHDGHHQPEPEHANGGRFIPHDSATWRTISHAMIRATSPQVYTYLNGLLMPGKGDRVEDTGEQKHENYWLVRRAAAGDVVMVRHLLDIGADAADRCGRWGPALSQAVRGCYDDVVDLLLERGADPNHNRNDPRLDTPLTAAARAGSMAMVRKLLDAGAEIQKKDSYMLRQAILKEHTAMAEMLLLAGVGTERDKSIFLGAVKKAGMDSMAELLESWGATELKKGPIGIRPLTRGS